MDVASKELCEQLYKLSWWTLPSYNEAQWVVYADESVAYWLRKSPEHWDEVIESFPGYDLGYLLNRLQVGWALSVRVEFVDEDHVGKRWEASFTQDASPVVTKAVADTPENAAAKLAIELFKKGILSKEAA